MLKLLSTNLSVKKIIIKSSDYYCCTAKYITIYILFFSILPASEKRRPSSLSVLRHSIVASIPACHAGDQGSIPCVGMSSFLLLNSGISFLVLVIDLLLLEPTSLR